MVDGLNARVVCLCGSFRFQEKMNVVRDHLLQQGVECLMPTPDTDVARGVRSCFERIDAADAVLIVNPGGYIGTSVLLDMGYAYARKKPLYALVEHEDPAVMSLITAVLNLGEECPETDSP